MDEVVKTTRMVCDCTSQAVTGALRSLLVAGLVTRAETHEGIFWRPSEAAERVQELYQPTTLLPVLAKIADLGAEKEDS
jgi:hypothetical protein